MKRKSINALFELIWLALSLVATIAVCDFAFSGDLVRFPLDSHHYSIYFVFAAAIVGVPLFFCLTFLIYFIKEVRHKFNRALPNTILFAAGMLLIVIIFFMNVAVFQFGMTNGGGRTAYPPLSALPQIEPGRRDPDQLLPGILLFAQIMVIAMLLYAAFQWGRARRT